MLATYRNKLRDVELPFPFPWMCLSTFLDENSNQRAELLLVMHAVLFHNLPMWRDVPEDLRQEGPEIDMKVSRPELFSRDGVFQVKPGFQGQ